MDWSTAIIIGAVCLGAGFFWGQVNRGVRLKTAASENDASQQASQKRLGLIFDLISTMTSTLIYNRVLELVLDLGAKALEGSTDSTDPTLVSGVFLFAPEGPKTVLRLATSWHMVQADQRAVLKAASGVVARVIDEGDPLLTNQIGEDPELSQLISLQSCRSLYCLPLRVGLDAYGVVIFAHPRPDFFTSAQQDVLGILTHQGVIALQNARLYNDLEKEKERMMETQEEARKKLARDLHDGPTQSVAALTMRVNYTRRLLQKDAAAAAEELEKIEDLGRRTTKEIRHMLFTLRPLVLESQGLVAALQAMAEKMRDTYNQKMSVEVDQSLLAEVEIGKQTVIFYIVEEAVNNARKHAQASNVWVRFKRQGSDLALLEIIDDGVGFDLAMVGTNYETRGSLGMVNLRERTDLINGLMRLDSAAGKGTTIQVIIPLTDKAADRLRQREKAR